MEIITYIIGALVVVSGIFSTVFFSVGHRDRGIWGSCVAVVLVVVGGFCWYQGLLWKQDAQNEKAFLLPGNEPFPELHVPPGKPANVPDRAFTIASNEVALLLGNFVVSTQERSFTVLKLYGKDLLKLTVAEGNKVRIWADIWDDDGRLLATFENSKLRVNKNNTLPLLRPDPHTLTIQNERKENVLLVQLINKRCIKIGGIFKAGGKYPVIINDNQITFGPLIIGSGIALHVQGSAIFEWPGTFKDKLYLGTEDEIPVDGAQLGVAMNNGAANLILRNIQGEEFSLFQIGGSNVPEGTELWPAFSFMLRKKGT